MKSFTLFGKSYMIFLNNRFDKELSVLIKHFVKSLENIFIKVVEGLKIAFIVWPGKFQYSPCLVEAVVDSDKAF